MIPSGDSLTLFSLTTDTFYPSALQYPSNAVWMPSCVPPGSKPHIPVGPCGQDPLLSLLFSGVFGRASLAWVSGSLRASEITSH